MTDHVHRVRVGGKTITTGKEIAVKAPAPKPPNKGRYRKPYPAREGGAGAKAEKRNDYDSDDATMRDRKERAEQRKRVRST